MILNAYAQAIVGGLVGGLSALQVALLTPGVTLGEGIVITFAILLGAGLISAIPDPETFKIIDQIRTERRQQTVRKVMSKD